MRMGDVAKEKEQENDAWESVRSGDRRFCNWPPINRSFDQIRFFLFFGADLTDLSSFSFLIRDKFMSLFCNGAVFLASASGLSDRRAFRLGIPSGDEDLDLEREDLELPDDDRLPLRLLFGLLDLLEDDLEEDLEEPDE